MGKAFIFSAVAALAGCLSGCGDEPDGPGVPEGSLFPDLAWEGYVNDSASGLASAQPFVDYPASTMGATGRRWALVHTSESF